MEAQFCLDVLEIKLKEEMKQFTVHTKMKKEQKKRGKGKCC